MEWRAIALLVLGLLVSPVLRATECHVVLLMMRVDEFVNVSRQRLRKISSLS